MTSPLSKLNQFKQACSIIVGQHQASPRILSPRSSKIKVEGCWVPASSGGRYWYMLSKRNTSFTQAALGVQADPDADILKIAFVNAAAQEKVEFCYDIQGGCQEPEKAFKALCEELRIK